MSGTPIDGLAGRYNIRVKQHATYKAFITWTTGGAVKAPINNKQYKALLQVKSSYESPQVLYEASSVKGNITLYGESGRIMLRFSHLDTGALRPQSSIYDLLLISPANDVYCILEGDFIVLPGVSRYTTV